MQKKKKKYIGFISTTVQGVKKNTIPTQIIFSRAGATASCPWSYCSVLTHAMMFPSIGAGLWKKLNSLNKVFWSELKFEVLWKNLGCLYRLAACFISFFTGLCRSQMVYIYLVGFLYIFWQRCLNKGAICTAQSHTDVVSVLWVRELLIMFGVFFLREMGMNVWTMYRVA